MNKQEVLEKLCTLVSKVGEEHFNNKVVHDCICGQNPFSMDEVHEDVIGFIELAVREKLGKPKLKPLTDEEKQAIIDSVLLPPKKQKT